MTDMAATLQAQKTAAEAMRKRRYAADARLRWYGRIAISVAILLLLTLLVTISAGGYKAFIQTHATIDFPISEELVDRADPAKGDWRAVVRNGIEAAIPGIAASELRKAQQILTNNTQFFVRDAVVADPSVIGKTLTMRVPVSDPYDQMQKGVVSRHLPEERRRLTDREIEWFDALASQGRISTPFNWGLLFNADSRFPEIAGLSGAIVGSFYALMVCFLISFPVGIAAAVYLEEFAPKNRITDIIEVNINNLAAVPSIVFGLLGLAVFLQMFGLPRSAPLVGGMVLSLMTLPTIIIVTRAALKSVPPSIREAAAGIGASPHQVILHHVLPLALPGILTGTIIGLAQALGETAPLLLIGMNAFITSPPGGVMEASTALPTQIFIWADSPERGFVARTSAGIMVLLGFLLVMNAIAIFLRQRLERRW
ncbi:phosphate ABC transporter permease PstA [Mariluticola halotolerans]|uniref:phosphate ABC transporter permease PstA n=1 Tax=Mariluticola halotolerans TaxID=2909283 RepID=UPI0026E43415|nr:phosphate ABC transporter permease PstA [Mariluticola halotolerans]UJQ93053.1 phosphate ABC transporter permease PstA [Mariluticola halotolerans]